MPSRSRCSRRRRGETVRNLIDCLIAAVAIRCDVPVLHAHRDYEAITNCSELRAVQA